MYGVLDVANGVRCGFQEKNAFMRIFCKKSIDSETEYVQRWAQKNSYTRGEMRP